MNFSKNVARKATCSRFSCSSEENAQKSNALLKAQYPKVQSLELTTNGDAAVAVGAPAVVDDEAAGAEAPNS